MAAINDALAEVIKKLAENAPTVEGLRDDLRLNIFPETQPYVQAALEVYVRRMGHWEAVKVALEALIADGPEDIPNQPISETALLDLQQNKATIDAALAQFTPVEEATGFTFSSGPELPK